MRKIITIILSFAMILSLNSTTTFAANSLSGTNKTISSSGSYALTSSIYATSSGDGNALTIMSGVSATVTSQGRQIYAKGKNYNAIVNYGTLTFDSPCDVYSYSGGSGKPIVNYGSLTLGEGTRVYATMYGDPYTISEESTAIINNYGATLDVNGSIIAGKIINRGTIVSNITSGYFYDDMSAYVENGYECVENMSCYGCRYTVQKKSQQYDIYICNGVGYKTTVELNSAIADGTINESTPITFSSDVKNGTIKIRNPIVVDIDTSIVIDCESSEVTLEDSSVNFLSMTKGNVTLKNGTLKYYVGKYSDDSPFDCSGGKLKIENIAVGKRNAICSSAFYGCSSLTNIEIPDGVTSIGYEAFYGCNSLTSIYIPDSVTSIGEYAFLGCSSIANFVVDRDNKYYDSRENCNAIIETSSNSLIYGCENTIIPDGVTSIGDCAFEDCSSLTSIEIPRSVTSIGREAFYGCSSLTNIYIPDSVTSIGDCAFEDCSSLTSIEISSSVTSIGNYAFYDVEATAYYESDEWLSTMKGNYGGTLTWVKKSHAHNCQDNTHNWQDTIIVNNENLKALATTQSPLQYWKVCLDCGKISTTEYFEYGEPIPDAGKCGDDATYTLDYDGTLTISGTGELYNASVTFLPWGGNTNKIKKVIINKGVTYIGREAFYGCSSLTSIYIPDSVTRIGESAFRDCSSLTNIEIPSGVTSIYNYTFCGCSSLTSIEIPDSVTRIGESAFRECNTLTNIEIPSSVTRIDDYTFCGCSSLTSVYIPDGVTSIGEGAFSGCGLTSIEIPSSVTRIGGHAFSGCGLTSIYIPDGVTSIGESAFIGCSSLTSMEIPSGVTSIGCYTFCECSSLTSIYIPDSVTSIGNYAFCSCRSLASIDIPDGVTSIGQEAFYGCSSLTSIFIPNSLTSIGESAFRGCSSLTNIEIPSSVTCIGSYAFLDCRSLKKVNITDLTAWCKISFCDNSNPLEYTKKLYINDELVTELEIPSDVTSIGNYAFYGCSGLASIEIPSDVTSIGNYAFYGCSGLASIEIPSSVTSIGEGAFRGCSSLTSIEIPSGVTGIDDYTFCECSSLTSIDILDGVTSIGHCAFGGCSSLTSIDIPDSVTSIGNYTFSRCSSLTSIELPISVTSIFDRTFENVTATVYCDSDEWLSTMKGDYGGTLTWVLSTAEFETVSVNVGSSLTLQTSVSVTENIDNPKMRYTINGSEVVKDGTLKDGKWYFELDGITPNLMASNIMMEVTDGDKVVAEKEYCIKEYCDALYSSSADELGMTVEKKEKLDIFLADMLEYGAMTQKYLGKTSGGLANNSTWVAEKKTSTFIAPSSEKNTIVSARDSYDKIVSAYLALNDCVETHFVLKVTDATQVEIFDGTNTKTIQLDANPNGETIAISVGKLTATELDTMYTITLKENDTTLHQVTYSVNSYIASKCNDTDLNLANLVKAIYNYGLSAKEYQKEVVT